jgi:hypothetical protein
MSWRLRAQVRELEDAQRISKQLGGRLMLQDQAKAGGAAAAMPHGSPSAATVSRAVATHR